jgi:hypothetical protein
MADQQSTAEQSSTPTASTLVALVRLLARQAAWELVERRSDRDCSAEAGPSKQAQK